MPYYAVVNGRIKGVLDSWKKCETSIKCFKNASYKRFNTETEAQDFINNSKKLFSYLNSDSSVSSINKPINKSIDTNSYYVYTDGSCINNGKPNAKAGIGIYFGDNDPRNVSEKIIGKQTNNIAELTAIIKVFSIIKNDINNGKNITIVTDSEYSIRCATTYGEKCAKDNWSKKIPNFNLVKKVYELYKDVNNVKFKHIKAHTNNSDIHSIGNEHADRLANEANGITYCPYNSKNSNNSNKIYLDVPFLEKNKVKTLGGLWDKNKKKWYIKDNNNNKNRILSIFSVSK